MAGRAPACATQERVTFWPKQIFCPNPLRAAASIRPASVELLCTVRLSPGVARAFAPVARGWARVSISHGLGDG